MSLRIKKLMECFLELIGSKGSYKDEDYLAIAEELNVLPAMMKQVVDFALEQNYVTANGGKLYLTDKGSEQIEIHRQQYIHDKFLFPKRRRKRRRYGQLKSAKEWHEHWHDAHDLDDYEIKKFVEDGLLSPSIDRIEHVIPLSMVEGGQRVLLKFMFGKRNLLRRLAELGMTPETEIIVKKGSHIKGSVRINVRGMFLALGPDVARFIFVEPFP
ncbi:FeoA family protein [Candidatus Borrarchaeum sp.]|uniref:FeoA family protein n=1 Tax=Candidatus Borrarchaeum sp. TaxID=2846742 RepID=UPI0025807CB7|nr:FeoA family protein [Candidatus Borrarchaeum sp.]